MSTNPQWSKFQPPIMNSDPSILEYKTLTSLNDDQANFRGFNNPFQASVPNKDSSNLIFGKPSSAPFNYSAYNGSSAMTFPISTFSATERPNPNQFAVNGDVFNSNSVPTNLSGVLGSQFNSITTTTATTTTTTTLTNNSSNDASDSNAANQGIRETGIIEKLLHSYGFIQCCERQARLFFHFSQFSGNIEHLKIGDPVEFEMSYDRRTGKPIASAVSKIAPEVVGVVMSEERVTGTVTTEIKTEGNGQELQGRISYENRGECFFLPYNKDDIEGNVTLRSGDKVSFQIAANQSIICINYGASLASPIGYASIVLLSGIPLDRQNVFQAGHILSMSMGPRRAGVGPRESGNLGACHIRLENPAHPIKYQGVVCSMKESFGFIERADVVKEIFFHFSEAKLEAGDELHLGDDVQFIIQTRNGKEVACNITRLEPGSVVFEDVCTEIVKGQVLKPLERGQHARQQEDALPGRIRYRAADHSEVEIPFGEKDQCGDFTLRHGDWVEFRIATDRRDQLQRAINISLMEESFLVSGERREQGIIFSLKDGFGFINCADRDLRVFFHLNEVLDVDRETQVNDEVEFTIVQDSLASYTNSNNRQSAIRIKHLPPGTVQFETLIEENLTGIVAKEAQSWGSKSPSKMSPVRDDKSPEPGLINYQQGEMKKSISYCHKDTDSKAVPRLGDKVEFNVVQVKRNKKFLAVDVKVVSGKNQTKVVNGVNNGNGKTTPCQGFIAALKDGFGFIETASHDREVFFHFSNFDGDPEKLELGQEVEYNLGVRSSGSCMSAETVKLLPKGTIPPPVCTGPMLDGIIVRPLRCFNTDQLHYEGLIQAITEDEKPAEYEFGILGLVNKRELLQPNDPVQFQVDSEGRAANIVAMREKRKATVDAVKGHFGFLSYELEDGKKLFFHMTEVKEGVLLQPGDTVEFNLVINYRNGKTSARNVTKVSDNHQRPERLISRLRTISLDEGGRKLTVLRQPRGPNGTKGFSSSARSPRPPGAPVPE